MSGSSSRHSHSTDDDLPRRMGSSARFSWEESPNDARRQEEQDTPRDTQGVLMVPPMRAQDPETGLLFNQQEYQKYLSIRGRLFEHTKVLDPALLINAGMATEFTSVFNALGWQSFWQVDELGIRLLTIEFLCSLQVAHDRIFFRMFNQEFDFTWNQLSIALGFDDACLLDINHACRRFNKVEFWESITTSYDCSNPTPDEIHNPTL